MCSVGTDEQTTDRNDEMLISLRSAVVLLTALFVASAAGILTFASTRDVAHSFLAAGGAFLAATVFVHNTVISRRP